MKFTSAWRIVDPLSQYIIYLRKSRKDMDAEALGQTDTLKRHRAAHRGRVSFSKLHGVYRRQLPAPADAGAEGGQPAGRAARGMEDP